MFDYIYIIPIRRKHDSGYYIFEIYGEIYDKTKKLSNYYCLGTYSDVIDFEKIACIYDRAVSMDMPEYNVLRLFTRCNYKFLIPFFYCSSFVIEVREV